MKMTCNGRWPLKEDDHKLWYLSSNLLDLPHMLNISSWDQNKVKKGLNEDDLQWKMTSKGRWPQRMKVWISQQPLIGYSSNFKHKLIGPNQSKKRFQWKTTSNGRWPQNMKSWIYQPPLIGSLKSFKHELMGPYQIQISFQWRWTSKKDDF